MSAGDNSNYHLRQHKPGAVWAKGADLDRAARRPALESSDGSITVTPHALRTNLTAAVQRPVAQIAYSATTDRYSIRCWPIIQDSYKFYDVDVTWTFEAPAAGTTAAVGLFYCPVIVPSRGGEYRPDQAVFWHSGTGSGYIAAVPYGTATAEAQMLLPATPNDAPYHIRLANIILRPGGAFDTYRGTPAEPLGVSPRTLNAIPHLCYPLYRTPCWCYSELTHTLLWNAARNTSWGHPGSTVLPLGTQSQIWIGADFGWSPVSWYLTDPSSATKWGLQIGTITPNASGRLTEWQFSELSYWAFEPYMFPPRGKTGTFGGLYYLNGLLA